MLRFRTSLAVASVVIGVGAAVGFSFYRGKDRTESSDRAAAAAARPAAGWLPSLPNTPATTTVVANPVQPIASRVDSLMQSWRTAIINKDPDVVESLDRTFASYPREFIPALMASAQNDPEERVRSFSTRVLGKLRPPESAEVMRKLLSDHSEYVRFNAAWALGELVDHYAAARLRLLEKQDPSPRVRQSAVESLRKLEGG